MTTDTTTPQQTAFGLRLSSRIAALLDRVQPPESAVLVVTALIVGLGTGLGAVAFNYFIHQVEWVGFEWLPRVTSGWPRGYVVIAPLVGGLVAGPLIAFFAREAKGHGVPEVMEAVALQGGRIRPIVVVIKAVASSVTIGSGGSAGREGPIVQIGSALGSTLGQGLRLSESRIRNLVACGAAGGIAAQFNAPIAGVIFALEIILGELSIGNLGSIVVAAVSASVVARAAMGDLPMYELPQVFSLVSVWEFGLYPILAVLAALAGWAFVRLLYWTEDVFEAMRRVPEWVQPAIGGLLMGGMALAYGSLPQLGFQGMPQVFGGGHEVVEAAFSGQFTVMVALAFLVLKLLATSLTLGSGGSGGIFAPGLFMGAVLGTAFGSVVNAIFPGVVAPPGAYALVGMGAVFAASAHAPMTAVLILFELTGDYRIILPLMLTVIVSTLLARWWLDGESIYTLKLTRRGVRLAGGRDIDVLQSVTVGEVMRRKVDTVRGDSDIIELAGIFESTHRHGLPVIDEAGRLIGIVTITDLDAAMARNVSRTTTVAEIATMQNLLVTHPDEPISVAMQRMGTRDVGRLPVVNGDGSGQLVGVISSSDATRAYSIALMRRAAIQHRAERIKLRNLDGAEFVEMKLSAESNVVGKRVQEIADRIPYDCVLISLRRGGRVMIPHGDTLLSAGDHITAFVDCDCADDLRQAFLGKDESP